MGSDTVWIIRRALLQCQNTEMLQARNLEQRRTQRFTKESLGLKPSWYFVSFVVQGFGHYRQTQALSS